MNSWPITTTFSWLVLKERRFTRDYLKNRGLQGPTKYPPCVYEEENMNHLLEDCPFSFSLWDRGETIFCRSNKVEGQPDQTLKEWNMKEFKNRILRMIWVMFSGILSWVLWKERNNRIFWDNLSIEDDVWKRIIHNI